MEFLWNFDKICKRITIVILDESLLQMGNFYSKIIWSYKLDKKKTSRIYLSMTTKKKRKKKKPKSQEFFRLLNINIHSLGRQFWYIIFGFNWNMKWFISTKCEEKLYLTITGMFFKKLYNMRLIYDIWMKFKRKQEKKIEWYCWMKTVERII